MEDLLDHSLEWIKVIYERATRKEMEMLINRELLRYIDRDNLIAMSGRKSQVPTDVKPAPGVVIMGMPGWGYSITGKGSK